MAQQSLCCLCASITVTRLYSDSGFAHLSDVRELATTAQSCVLCRLLLDEALQRAATIGTRDELHHYASLAEALDDMGVESSQSLSLTLKIREKLVYCYLKDGHKDYGLLGNSLRIFSSQTYPEVQAVITDQVPIGAVVTETLDLDRMAVLVQGWVNECITSHDICQNGILDSNRPMPTRVIDVDFGDSNAIRVVQPSEPPHSYIALSHCWGDSQPLKTTNANLRAHANCIETTALPPTFHDAVVVTRRLGVRYLWIDSLCIIQDDAEEWKREAQKIGSVYGNAYLTIAASRSTSSMSGFLGARCRDAIARIQFDTPAPVCIGHRHSFARDVRKSPLTARAWVVQERILSRRTLHFTTAQIYWECWTCQVGEDLDVLYPGVIKRDAYPNVFVMCALSQHDKHISSLHTPRQWWHLLTHYTTCQLTYQRDKLVAISGLIDRISHNTGHMAIAGIFEDVLHFGLLWSACDEPLERIVDAGVPSWSWASRKGRLNYVQMYDWAVNDELCLIKASTDSGATLRAQRRRLRVGVTITDMKNSSDYRCFPSELDFHATNFRFVSPDWIEDEDELGWVILDGDDGSALDWTQIDWIVVACNVDGSASDHDAEIWQQEEEDGNKEERERDDTQRMPKEGPFYCLLVRLKDGIVHERIGVGSVSSLDWFDHLREDVVIA